MRNYHITVLLSLFISLNLLFAQPNGVVQDCYHLGETIAEDIVVIDEDGQKQRLLDLVEPATKLIYLVLIGGPSLNPNRGEGGLWCGDSFNDMPISNFASRKYASEGVKFIPVVCPPVYHERRFGFQSGVFLRSPETSEDYQNAFRKFVEATQKLQKSRIIPFKEVYFDPHFRLLFNFNEVGAASNSFEENNSWLGKFKPCGDSQRYSTPTIWLLSPEGEILHEPFFGNRFAENRLEIKFTVRDVDTAIAELLEKNEE